MSSLRGALLPLLILASWSLRVAPCHNHGRGLSRWRSHPVPLPPTSDPCQVLSLGAGYDTLYWRLKSGGIGFSNYVELDFNTVTSRKLMYIQKQRGLLTAFQSEGEGSLCLEWIDHIFA